MSGFAWNEETKKKVLGLVAANPHVTPAHIAAVLGTSRNMVQRLLAANPEIMDEILVGRARGDNNIALKNYSMAMGGDSRAMDREMKKRGMIGSDFVPVVQVEAKRDYSKLSVEELEMLANLDEKTRGGPSGASDDGPRLLPPAESAG